MPTRPAHGRWFTVIVLTTPLAAGVGWGATRLLRGSGPLASGGAAYHRKAWREAASWARGALKADAADARAARLLARSSARLGNDDSALNLFRRLGPDGLEAEDDFLLARIFSRHDQAAAARARLWKAYRKDPGHGEALHELVRSLAQNDELTKAVELAVALAAVPGWQARGRAALGLLRTAQDDPAAAAEALESALDLDPNLEGPPVSAATVRKLLARQRLALGQPARARAALGTLDDPEARWLRARADLQEGKPCDDQPGPAPDPSGHEPAPYVGSARCAGCHPAIARKYRDSHHANTFWAGARVARLPLPDRPVPDPYNPSVAYRLRRDGDVTRAEARVVGGPLYRAVIAYALGSGDRGLTPVGRDEAGRWCELRLSRYADRGAWDVTTGHPRTPAAPSEWLGKTLSDDDLRRCVECHTTAPRAARADAGALAGDHGIGCERCHGPGGNHVRAVAAGLDETAIARPGRASGATVVRLCGQCHSPRRSTPSPADPASIRFQATTLTWSRCYTQSRGALDCLTCHDPHRDAETAPASYESKCLDCHGPSAATRCNVRPTRDCIGCHMPTVRGVVPHSPFTDHHIRVHSPSQ
jgi:tetratricopeptide (TPR) repeat protein